MAYPPTFKQIFKWQVCSYYIGQFFQYGKLVEELIWWFSTLEYLRGGMFLFDNN